MLDDVELVVDPTLKPNWLIRSWELLPPVDKLPEDEVAFATVP